MTYHHLPTLSLLQLNLLPPIHQKKLVRRGLRPLRPRSASKTPEEVAPFCSWACNCGDVFEEKHTIPCAIDVGFFQGNWSQSPGSSRTSTTLHLISDQA